MPRMTHHRYEKLEHLWRTADWLPTSSWNKRSGPQLNAQQNQGKKKYRLKQRRREGASTAKLRTMKLANKKSEQKPVEKERSAFRRFVNRCVHESVKFAFLFSTKAVMPSLRSFWNEKQTQSLEYKLYEQFHWGSKSIHVSKKWEFEFFGINQWHSAVRKGNETNSQ